MIRCFLILMLGCCLGIAIPQRTLLADSIGVGLDWRKNIFVQEYWQDGKVFYAIANKTDADQAIVVSAYRGGKKLAGPWKVGAHSLIHVDVSKLVGNDLLHFKLETGGSLGLLQSPVQPAEFPRAKIVTYDGLNGSGGRHSDLWAEQDALAFSPEQIVELRLIIPGDKEQLIVKNGDLDRVEVSCETLKVEQLKDQSTIDIAKPLTVQDQHTVVLKFKAPKLTQPTLITLDTWLWNRDKSGGHGITRGVAIEPAQ